MQSFKRFHENLQIFRNSGVETKLLKYYNHWSTLGIIQQCIITCSNFVLPNTGSDSVMCAKFQMNLMRYGEPVNEQRYQKDSLWKLFRSNLGECAKKLRCILANSKYVFSSTKTVSVICAKFQVVLQEFPNFQKFRRRKESGKMLQPLVNSRNASAVHHNLLKLCFIDNSQWFGDVYKISINLMRYGEFPNEQRYKRDSLWRL